jgi:hypothetical protein
MDWFSTKGQVIQVICAVITGIVGLLVLKDRVKGWLARSITAVLLIIGVGFSVWRAVILSPNTTAVFWWSATIFLLIIGFGWAGRLLATRNRGTAIPVRRSLENLDGASSLGVPQKPCLTPRDIWLERADAHNFKRKLRIVLTNDSGKNIVFHPPAWSSEEGDVPTRPLPHISFEIEGTGGWEADRNDSWQKEVNVPTLVTPGRAIRTWVGLAELPETTEVAIRRRTLSKRLGVLHVSFEKDGQVFKEDIRF